MDISDHSLFSGLPKEIVLEIVKKTSPLESIRRFSKGETVVYEGTKAEWLMPVLFGRITVFESGAGGERHLSHLVDANEVFGHTLVTANLTHYPGLAVASQSSEVAFMEISKIRSLWHNPRYAKLFENLYTIVSNEALRHWRKLTILSCKTAEGRIMLYLRGYASQVCKTELELPFANSEAMAQYLGITRTALSLAVTRLVERGEIAHLGRNRFILLSRAGKRGE